MWDPLGAANVSSQDEMLCAAGARIGIESLPGKVHHKFAVIDVEGDDRAVDSARGDRGLVQLDECRGLRLFTATGLGVAGVLAVQQWLDTIRTGENGT